MNYNTQAMTLDLKICRACGIKLLSTNRFCRLCGARQGYWGMFAERNGGISNLIPNTRILAPQNEINASSLSGYRSISGSVLNSLVTSELTNATSRIKSRAAKRAVAAAMAIPLWLMIVLLSPLDALEASRQVSKQV